MRLADSQDQPPQPTHVRLPRWPGLVAHARHGDEAVYATGEMLGPDGPVDMRCGHCRADAEVRIEHGAAILVFVIRHQPGCQALADMIEMAGAR